MSINRALFSSLSGDWTTPKGLYKDLDKEFHFTFDPCPTNPTFDGLEVKWGSSNFVNPPYGRVIHKWITRGIQESRKGNTVVFLLPARTDTKWFHEQVIPFAREIRFIRGRLKFGGSTNSAPFPSMIVVL